MWPMEINWIYIFQRQNLRHIPSHYEIFGFLGQKFGLHIIALKAYRKDCTAACNHWIRYYISSEQGPQATLWLWVLVLRMKFEIRLVLIWLLGWYLALVGFLPWRDDRHLRGRKIATLLTKSMTKICHFIEKSLSLFQLLGLFFLRSSSITFS